jgi:hypothetical protein
VCIEIFVVVDFFISHTRTESRSCGARRRAPPYLCPALCVSECWRLGGRTAPARLRALLGWPVCSGLLPQEADEGAPPSTRDLNESGVWFEGHRCGPFSLERTTGKGPRPRCGWSV